MPAHSHHRRQRPVHRRSGVWAARAVCALAGAGLVAVAASRHHPPAPARSDPVAVCALVRTVTDLAFVGISPEPDATPEDFAAVQRANAQLAQVREAVLAGVDMKELGCG